MRSSTTLAQAAAQPEELDVALTPVEQRAILAALKAGQAYAEAAKEARQWLPMEASWPEVLANLVAAHEVTPE
jgi:hypothetical protein